MPASFPFGPWLRRRLFSAYALAGYSKKHPASSEIRPFKEHFSALSCPDGRDLARGYPLPAVAMFCCATVAVQPLYGWMLSLSDRGHAK